MIMNDTHITANIDNLGNGPAFDWHQAVFSDGTVRNVSTKAQHQISLDGNVLLNGRNLEDRLATIEKVLHIPQRDVNLENNYPKLKEIYKQYQQELEKIHTWEALKGNK